MIIVWRGLGILVLLIFVLANVITKESINSITGGPGYFESHGWPKLLSCVIAAGLVFFISKLRSREEEPSRDSLFFIPMWIWSFIFVVVGLFWAAAPAPDRLSTGSDQPDRVYAREPAPPPTPQTAPPPKPPITTPAQPANVAAGQPAPSPADRTEQRPQVPASMTMQPAKPARATNELRLQGIFYAPGNRGTAEISDRTVVVGDHVLGYTVLSIEPQGVMLRSADGTPRTLSLADIGR